MSLRWTADFPDDRLALVRLAPCNHVAVIARNMTDLTGLSAYCRECERGMAIVRDLTRPEEAL